MTFLGFLLISCARHHFLPLSPLPQISQSFIFEIHFVICQNLCAFCVLSEMFLDRYEFGNWSLSLVVLNSIFSNFTFPCFWKVSLYRILMKSFYEVQFCWMACKAMDVHRENLLQELDIFLFGIRSKSDHWYEGLIYQQWWIVITHNSFTLVSCVLYP